MITIEIPMAPDSKLFPNNRHRRGGFYPGVAVAKECRETAQYAAMAEHHKIDPIAGPVSIEIHAAYGYKRQLPDLDATISACKPFIDGLVDAGVLVDDGQVQRLAATHEKVKARKGFKPTGYTRITISELAA